MTANGYLQLVFYVVVLLALAKPLGAYMARIYEGEPAFLNRIGAPFERLIYRLCGVDASKEMRWTEYAIASLVFSLVGLLLVYGLQRLQAFLPLNPASMAAVSPDSSFNTAVSFVTNTNWQGYGGESTMSYLTQMAGADGAELRLRGAGHGGGDRADPRIRPPVGADHRQFLGRSDPRHAVHPAAARFHPGAGSRVAGRGADVLRLSDRAAGRIGGIRQPEARRGRPADQGRRRAIRSPRRRRRRNR